MKRINVIDLDSTLLPYDSFGKLVKNELRKFNLYIWFESVLRILRIISSYTFKQRLTKYWGNKYNQSFFYDYAKMIHRDLDEKILDIISSKMDDNTKNILISASPNLYVKELISLLGWEGSGSYFEDNNFVNLYSKEKIEWLTTNYPESEFNYNFAISDSHSDDKLLSLFKDNLLVKSTDTATLNRTVG